MSASRMMFGHLRNNAPIITRALLRSEWNDVDILYATERHIGRLTWATGA
jgi:hypothetical protein